MNLSKLNNNLIKQTIESLVNLLEGYYVFPDTALKISAVLLKKQAAGEFDECFHGQSLAESITTLLQEMSQDTHLNLQYSEDRLPPESEDRGLQEDMKLRLKLNNYGFEKVERLPGNIGLLVLNQFTPPEIAGETAANAMSFLGDTSGLIIDLRNNSGGTSFMVSFISSYLLDSSIPVHLNDLYWRSYNVTQSFWSFPFVPGKKYGGNKPVIVLTSKITCSAAEEFAYSLQAIDRALIIGEKTKGGANPGRIHRINEHFQVFIPNGRAINPKTKDNWEGKGVMPNLMVESEKALDTAYTMLLQQELEKLTECPIPGQEQLIVEMKKMITLLSK